MRLVGTAGGFGSSVGVVVLGLIAWAMQSSTALADQFHYNNVLVGTRAVGMGGAFTGVADDASGLYYNPGGLAFALSNDIQGSANAFYAKTTTYKKALGGTDFSEQSSGSLTPFFGGLQKLDRYMPGMVAAFGVYYTDGDLKDQDNTILGQNIASTTIDRYHRTSNERAATYYGGAAVAFRPLPSLGVGFGLTYTNADELVQEFQYARQSVSNPGSTAIAGWSELSSNVREHLAVYGMQPVLGIQATLPKGFTVGLTLKKTFVASQRFDSESDVQQTLETTAQANAGTTSNGSTTVTNPQSTTTTNVDIGSHNPVGTLPFEARLGFAWFASPTLLFSLDIEYTDSVTDADKGTDANNLRAVYQKNSVTNYAAGMEWYVTPSFPVRAGVFTNYDARPQVAQGSDPGVANPCSTDLDYYKKYCAQPDHIDYYGGSLFIAWVQPNSQISAGVTLQEGSGHAQKLGDDTIQKVTSSQYTIAFSATHNL